MTSQFVSSSSRAFGRFLSPNTFHCTVCPVISGSITGNKALSTPVCEYCIINITLSYMSAK